jgi:DNA-binding response OmpR family regulator
MSSERILVIEDDLELARLEEAMLRRAGYDYRICNTGAAGLEMARSYKPMIVLLDVGLPDMSGFDVCRTLADTSDAYILMVSAQNSERDKLTGLGLGADDYITKPFSPSELLARIASFLRRNDREKSREVERTLEVGNVTLLRDMHVVRCANQEASLTALEFRLLWFLGEAEGRLLTRGQILERVWNDVSGVPTRVVDVHVAALRKKIGEIGAQIQIASVRGIGYRLDAVESPVNSSALM